MGSVAAPTIRGEGQAFTGTDWVRFAQLACAATKGDISRHRSSLSAARQNRASPCIASPLAGGDAGRRNVRPIPPPIVRVFCQERARRNRTSSKNTEKRCEKILAGARLS